MPERIGAYRLESPLGRGGMGEVFLAWDERLERAVAIKRIRHDAFVQGHQRERFRREARMAARLSHAAIVQVHDLVSEESGDAIVMEYVEGPTLSERLARGTLGVAEAVHLAKEIAEGLAAAHEAGLIHRDLKTENVVITPSGHAKILDFGLARPVSWDGEMLTQHGALVGTCYAMSPEQASGGDLDERSDLFSLGALLYEMLAGCSAFRAKDPHATLQRVLYEQPEPLAEIRPDLPPGLVSLVERLLAKDRDDRPRNALSVVHKLERIERELPVEEEWPERKDDSVSEMPTHAFPVLPQSRSGATAPRSTPKVEGALRRARGWILFLGGALAALVVAVAAMYMLNRRPAEPPKSLRVLILMPEILDAQENGLEFVQLNVLSSSLNSLSRLQGISVLGPSMAMGSRSTKEAARRAAADEVLVSSIQKEGEMARVLLLRVQADGKELTRKDFLVPVTSDSMWRAAQILNEQLQSVFEGFSPLPDGLQPVVAEHDYAEYVGIRQRLAKGTRDLRPELKRLDRIIESSPRFPEAPMLAADLSLALYQSTREPTDLRRTESYVRQARKLAPEDSRTLTVDFNTALAAQRYDKAQRILAQLEEGPFGDPDVLSLRAALEESQGRLKQAEKALRQAVDRAPSWQNVVRLARLEMSRDKIDEARTRLEGLLEQAPTNAWVKEQLASLELIYGDLEESERIYEELAGTNPQRSYFTSLGQARSLRHHFEAAAEAYSTALDMEPGHVIVALNLADTKIDLGDTRDANVLYGMVLSRLNDKQVGPGLPPKEEMMRAQCLARLGRPAEARQAVGQALDRASSDAERLYEAALVYSVLGDEEAVLTYTEAALKRGMPRRWFKDSTAFDSMRGNEEFRALLGSDRPEQGR